jgi:endonuclease YncB( thermonuclease family)
MASLQNSFQGEDLRMDFETVVVLLFIMPFAFGVLKSMLRASGGLLRRARLPKPFMITNAFAIDGDTLAKGKLRLRIWGIDAPEKTQPQGLAAQHHMARLTRGKTLQVIPRDIDRFGRLVAQVFVDGSDVGLTMVSDGYAIAETRYTRAYVRPMRQARRKRLGLWEHGPIANPAAHRRLQA